MVKLSKGEARDQLAPIYISIAFTDLMKSDERYDCSMPNMVR